MFKKISDKADRSPILKSHFSLQLFNAVLLDQILQKRILSIDLKLLRYLFFQSFICYWNLHGYWRHGSHFACDYPFVYNYKLEIYLKRVNRFQHCFDHLDSTSYQFEFLIKNSIDELQGNLK